MIDPFGKVTPCPLGPRGSAPGLRAGVNREEVKTVTLSYGKP